jgi:hypothetical protein
MKAPTAITRLRIAQSQTAKSTFTRLSIATQPLWRGSICAVLDAYTGKEIWKSLNFVSGMAVADGCL